MRCHEARQALGVYVLGAIDPAERELLDAHLARCPGCREELAGLAGLPALLGRVPRADAELLALDGHGAQSEAEPPPELLDSLLNQVAARRRARRWRGVAAAAAAAVIAVGGGLTAASLGGGQAPGPPQNAASPQNTASATNARTHISAVVDYRPAGAGTAVRVQVSGIAPGTICRLWVISGGGKRTVAGRWTVLRSYGAAHWYPVSTPVPAGSVRAFQITEGNRNLLVIRA